MTTTAAAATAQATSVGLLPRSLQNSLEQLVIRTNAASGGIRVILLSTAEGVPLGRTYAESPQLLNESVLSSIESTWAPASKPLPLLHLSKVQSVTAVYDHGILIHLYQAPLVVTILANPMANLGAIRSTAIPLLKELLDPLCQTLLHSLAPSQPDAYPPQGYYQ